MNRLRILKSLETLCRGFGCRRLAGGGGGGGLGMGGATVMGLGLRAAGGGLGWRIEVMLTRMKLNEVALMFLLEIGLKLMEFPLTPFPQEDSWNSKDVIEGTRFLEKVKKTFAM